MQGRINELELQIGEDQLLKWELLIVYAFAYGDEISNYY
jgi:hypothetical protein